MGRSLAEVQHAAGHIHSLSQTQSPLLVELALVSETLACCASHGLGRALALLTAPLSEFSDSRLVPRPRGRVGLRVEASAGGFRRLPFMDASRCSSARRGHLPPSPQRRACLYRLALRPTACVVTAKAMHGPLPSFLRRRSRYAQAADRSASSLRACAAVRAWWGHSAKRRQHEGPMLGGVTLGGK